MKLLLTLALIGLTQLSFGQQQKVSPNSKTYNLLKQEKSTKLHEGENVFVTKPGYSIIAQVKDGKIYRWIAKDKAGKEYLPM